jgi:hypothetical protein
MAFLLSILEIPHSNFAWRPSIITKHLCGFSQPLQRIRTAANCKKSKHILHAHLVLSSTHARMLPTRYLHIIYQVYILSHTKFHTQIDGIIIITIINFSRLFFKFNACLLKEERSKKKLKLCRPTAL